MVHERHSNLRFWVEVFTKQHNFNLFTSNIVQNGTKMGKTQLLINIISLALALKHTKEVIGIKANIMTYLPLAFIGSIPLVPGVFLFATPKPSKTKSKNPKSQSRLVWLYYHTKFSRSINELLI